MRPCLFLRPFIVPFFLIFFYSSAVDAQSLYVQQGTKHQSFLERLEIILQTNPELNIYTPSSIPRETAVQLAGLEDSSSGNPSVKLSSVDQKNLLSFLRNNAEYVTWDLRRKHILYRNWANFFEINKENFYLNLNPVGLAQQSYETSNDDPVYHVAGGASLRGLIGKKFGFYSYFTKHAESAPLFLRRRIEAFNAVPGAGYYETYKKRRGYVYYDLRGGINLNASKHFNAEVAFDRNFIGDGYRSLILSDYGYSYLYLKTNLYLWKLRYQVLYARLADPFSTGSSREEWPYGEKTMFLHQVSLNATKWLNVGVFQSLIRNNPTDKNIAGAEFKANVAHRAQFYGQLLSDNFNLSQATNGKGWWNNRYGFQLGAKYIDLFNVKNFDVQVELNRVRPYTYAGKDTLSSYSHYNQFLAHPLGANFSEWIGILRYQPHKRVTLYTRVIYWKQGYDAVKAENFGSNIFKQFTTRPYDYNVEIGNGYEGTGMNAQFQFSYEVAENIFFDAMVLRRKINYKNSLIPTDNTTLLSAGIRMNIFKRDYDF